MGRMKGFTLDGPPRCRFLVRSHRPSLPLLLHFKIPRIEYGRDGALVVLAEAVNGRNDGVHGIAFCSVGAIAILGE